MIGTGRGQLAGIDLDELPRDRMRIEESGQIAGPSMGKCLKIATGFIEMRRLSVYALADSPLILDVGRSRP